VGLKLGSIYPGAQYMGARLGPISCFDATENTGTSVRNQIPVFKVIACHCIDRFTPAPICIGWNDIIKNESETRERR
jgi:hypothetical protein